MTTFKKSSPTYFCLVNNLLPILQYTSEADTSSQNTAVHGGSDSPQHDSENEVAALRAELEQTRMQAAQREAELLEEIARLQEALSRVSQPAPPTVIDLLDEIGRAHV